MKLTITGSFLAKQTLVAALAAYLLAGFGAAHGATFFADYFNYPDGGLTVADGTGANVSGGLWVPHSGETFGDNIDVISGQAELLNSGSEDANRSVPGMGFMGAGDKWYYAALVTVNDRRVDPLTESINNDYFMHFKDTGNGFRGRAYLDDPASGGDFRFGLSATSGGQTAAWGDDLSFGQQYMIVVSYDFDSGASELWVDPTDASSPKIEDLNAAGAGTFITSLGLRQDFISPGVPNNQILVDAVAIGDDFNDVIRSVVIPEPNSGLLALVGLVGWARRRRGQ